MGYVKLYDQLFSSSIIEEDILVRWVWVSLLMTCDKNGNIYGTIPALARKMNVTEEQLERGLGVLMAPDPSSTSPDHEGRRIIEAGPNLLFCVNYQKYRGMKDPVEEREKVRERVAKHRKTKARNTGNKTVTDCNPIAESIEQKHKHRAESISMARGEPKVSRRKKASSKPEYSQMFNEFWGKSWKRGHKRAAWDSLVAMDLCDQEMADVVIGDWTQAFERRPANMRPHVSTWLNNRGWEDDLSAELAKAKDDVRQVGKTPEKPTMNEEAEKERRKKAVKCIQKHAIHLLEVETDDDQAGKIIRKAAKGLSRLADSTAPPMDMANEFGVIHDQMLSDLFHTLPEEVKGGVDPEKSGYANEEAFLRCRATFRRKAAREFYEISDICDYDWGE